jgi:hypothetical protein
VLEQQGSPAGLAALMPAIPCCWVVPVGARLPQIPPVTLSTRPRDLGPRLAHAILPIRARLQRLSYPGFDRGTAPSVVRSPGSWPLPCCHWAAAAAQQ